MEERRRNYREDLYVDGNTVRRMEAAPDYRRERKEKKRRQEQIRRKHVARRNQQRALSMDFGYMLFLTCAVVVTACVMVVYIQMQSMATAKMKSIANLESQIATLKADNDATEKRLNTSVDMDALKNVAMNQYGMVYAGEDQIVYYSVESDDYMNQYGDIPQW